MINCNHHKIKFISFKSYIIYILKNKNKTTIGNSHLVGSSERANNSLADTYFVLGSTIQSFQLFEF